MITLKLFQQIFYLEMHILDFAMPLVLLERPNSREKGNIRYKIKKVGTQKWTQVSMKTLTKMGGKCFIFNRF